MSARKIIAGMKQRSMGLLEGEILLSVGMKAMVILNISTEADLANGTRGTITEIILDPQEKIGYTDKKGITLLQYPPALIIFKPENEIKIKFHGIPNGCLPITPSEKPFTIKNPDGTKLHIRQRQLALLPAYAFTDFKSQGQTIPTVFIDIMQPPQGGLTPFSVYVALSRSRGRENIRILRGFDEKLFTTHPSEPLRLEDIRLQELDKSTAMLRKT